MWFVGEGFFCREGIVLDFKETVRRQLFFGQFWYIMDYNRFMNIREVTI